MLSCALSLDAGAGTSLSTEKMRRSWSQQARQLTPRRGTVAHLGNLGCCVHLHTGNLSLFMKGAPGAVLLSELVFVSWCTVQ